MIVKRVSSCLFYSIHEDEIFIPKVRHIVERFLTDPTCCLTAVHSASNCRDELYRSERYVEQDL